MTEEIHLHRHISFAEFLLGKEQIRVSTAVPADAKINNSGDETVLSTRIDGGSLAEYWERLVEPKKKGGGAGRADETALLDPAYLEVEDYQLGLVAGDDRLDYTVKLALTEGDVEHRFIIDGRENNYVSEGMLRKDFKVMLDEEEPDFRDTLERMFADQVPGITGEKTFSPRQASIRTLLQF